MTARTRYAYDLEFLETGRTIDLISIGIVCEDGREYYAVSSDMPVDEINKYHDWLIKNVMPQLPGKMWHSPASGRSQFILDKQSTLVKPRWVIANEVREFLLAGEQAPELWADYGAYDHVALCQLWGRMIDLPDGLPMWTHEIQQAIEGADGYIGIAQEDGLHNALEDARHNMRVLRALGVVADA